MLRESKTIKGQLVLSVRLHTTPGKHACCNNLQPIASIIIMQTPVSLPLLPPTLPPLYLNPFP